MKKLQTLEQLLVDEARRGRKEAESLPLGELRDEKFRYDRALVAEERTADRELGNGMVGGQTNQRAHSLEAIGSAPRDDAGRAPVNRATILRTDWSEIPAPK